MPADALQSCSSAASQGGIPFSEQKLIVDTSATPLQHGAVQRSMQPSHVYEGMSCDSLVLQSNCKSAAEIAGSLCNESLAVSDIVPLKPHSTCSAAVASLGFISNELNGRRPKHRRADLSSSSVTKQKSETADGEHAQTNLDWAHRAGYYAVLTLGVIAGVLLFTYACAYHLYVVHGNPLALQEVPLLGLSHASAGPQAQAFKGSAASDELLSWEEMALRHGNEAVIILSDSNHREPILTARGDMTPLQSSIGRPHVPLADAAAANALEDAVPAAAAARTGFLGRMSQRHSKHATAQTSAGNSLG